MEMLKKGFDLSIINNKKIISYNYNSNLNIINSLSISSAITSLSTQQQVNKKINLNATQSSKKNWYLIEDLQKLLISYFKSIFCLISKAKFYQKADKLIIEIFYYITIPDANIFSWFNILNSSANNNAIKKIANNSNVTINNNEETINEIKNKNENMNLDLDLEKKLKKNKLIALIARKMKMEDFLDKFFKLNITNINSLFLVKFKSLVRWLNSIFNKPIELKLIRLHHSDSESHILAQLFFLVIKKKNIRSVINKIYNKNKIKDINHIIFSSSSSSSSSSVSNKNDLISQENQMVQLLLNNNSSSNYYQNQKNLSKYIQVFISGLYIHIGGRLMREPIIPRITTKKFEKGAIAQGKVNSLEKTQITRKNKKGAFTIKITFAQNII